MPFPTELALQLALFEGYAPIAFTLVVSAVIAFGMLGLSSLLGPSKPSKIKEMPYECGVEPLQESARERYSVAFYLVAILFILFDLETVFLFPWAATFKNIANSDVKLVLLSEVLLFVGVLGVGLLYVWKRKGLEWD